MKLTIKGRMPSLNDYVNECRKNKFAGHEMKQQQEAMVRTYIKKCLGNWKPKTPVKMFYTWYEINTLRDKDNIAFARKFIQDALVKAGTLPNDGWNEIEGFYDTFLVDKKNPRVEVEIVEYGELAETQPK